jgi:hypothetical protein
MEYNEIAGNGGLLLLALSFNCAAIAPIQIGGEHGQAALSMMANKSFTHNAAKNSDLWKWGGSPMGYGQLFPGQGQSNDFGGWAPEGETPLGYASNETPSGYTINETRQVFSGQEYSGNTQDWSNGGDNPNGYALDESNRLFPSQGFFNGYVGWEPLI